MAAGARAGGAWAPYALLVLGVYACSTAVIMIKASRIDPVLLSAYRLLVAAAALSPLMVRARRRHPGTDAWADLRRAVVPGALLGLHFVTWIVGARMTLSANASLIVNLVPVALPFLAFLAAHERLTRGELAGTAVALAGALLLGASDFHLSRRTFWGDVICFGSMLFFALYLAFARRNRGVPDLWLYLVPLYALAGVLCLALALATGRRPGPYSLREWTLVLGLGIVPTVIGHSILNHAMRRLRAQAVSIVNLGQFVFAGAMAFALFREAPTPAFYVASLLLVGGAVVAIRAAPEP
jgi:drug/metabolite transporter (DMT)-like permease